MTTLYKATMTGDIAVAPGYDCIELATGGADRTLSGIEGSGFPDGHGVVVICNGPETLTLLDGQAVGDGNVLFLPGGQSRVLSANSRPYQLRRNDGGARGDGWYGLTDGATIASGRAQLVLGAKEIAIPGVTADSVFLIQPRGGALLNVGALSYSVDTDTLTVAGTGIADVREFDWHWMS